MCAVHLSPSSSSSPRAGARIRWPTDCRNRDSRARPVQRQGAVVGAARRPDGRFRQSGGPVSGALPRITYHAEHTICCCTVAGMVRPLDHWMGHCQACRPVELRALTQPLSRPPCCGASPAFLSTSLQGGLWAKMQEGLKTTDKVGWEHRWQHHSTVYRRLPPLAGVAASCGEATVVCSAAIARPRPAAWRAQV